MSSATMTIALPEGSSNFVAERAACGQYGSTSEYICDLIRRHRREQEIARLRALVEEGLASGPGRPDTEADWGELDAIASGDKD